MDCRDFGKQLFMDADKLHVETAWGSFTEPEYIQSGPLSPLKGTCAFAWAGAVLHVLTAEDVSAFIMHVHAMLGPGGTLFGVSTAARDCDQALAFASSCCAAHIVLMLLDAHHPCVCYICPKGALY